jgi:hypothetical protein
VLRSHAGLCKRIGPKDLLALTSANVSRLLGLRARVVLYLLVEIRRGEVVGILLVEDVSRARWLGHSESISGHHVGPVVVGVHVALRGSVSQPLRESLLRHLHLANRGLVLLDEGCRWRTG